MFSANIISSSTPIVNVHIPALQNITLGFLPRKYERVSTRVSARLSRNTMVVMARLSSCNSGIS